MVGRALDKQSWRAPHSERRGPPVLTVDRLSTAAGTSRGVASPSAHGTASGTAASPAVLEATFALHAGEIAGLVGLVGAGRSELALALFGAISRTGGSMTLAGAPHRPRSPRDAERAGVALLPEDRKASALIGHESVRVNMTLARLRSLASRGIVVDSGRERVATERWMHTLRIKAPSIETPVLRLSGGNQQKVVLARWLIPGDAPLRVLILDEPTQGVDVGARAEIYDTLRELASGGAAVLVVTSDLVEALALCDRLLIMREGRLVGELTGDDRSAEQAAALMVPA
jgi:ABC-type sugar transport system ATPase subunit